MAANPARGRCTIAARTATVEAGDAAIAAHALAADATLVTANLDHTTRVPGLRIEDWARE
jgi:tRNA(fMet)-specific endonuclease VapC